MFIRRTDVEAETPVKRWPPAATWMDLGIMILNEVRKGKTNTMWYHLYVESKIWHKWTCEWNKHRLTERTDLWLTRGRRAGGGKDWKFGINRSKLLLFICRTDKQWGPTYSTENCIPYPVRNHNGKKIWERIYICISELLWCTAEINTL